MGRGVGIGGGIALTYSAYVDSHHIAIAHKRLGMLHVSLQLTYTLSAEL